MKISFYCPVVHLLATSILLVLNSTPAFSEWQPYGPLTVERMPDSSDQNGEEKYTILFPLSVIEPNFWAGVVKTYAAPRPANEMKICLRSSFDGPITLKATDSEDMSAYFTIQATTDWVDHIVDLTKSPQIENEQGKSSLRDVSKLTFIFNGGTLQENPEATVDFVEPVFSDNETTQYINDFWMPQARPAPVPGYRIETCIHNIWPPDHAEFGGLNNEKSFRAAVNIAMHLKDEYGNVGITIAYLNGENSLKFSELLKAADILPMSEGHNTPGIELLDSADGWIRDENGQTPLTRGSPIVFHAEDTTNPEVLKALQSRILDAAKAGGKVWRSVDYVTHHWGGPVWGFSKSTMEQYRQDLLNLDAGITMKSGESFSRAGFWEYFESYTGYRMKPSDCGLENWKEYSPPRSDDTKDGALLNRQTLYGLLFHYEWVKYINDAAAPAGEYGLQAQPILNPESYATGTDAYWLLRCANVRGFATEWWHGADAILSTYYNAQYYQDQAARNQKEIILLGESAAAGGNPWERPNYWDNRANYLITYAQASSFDAKAKHDQYWGSSWDTMANPKNPEYQSFTAFHSAWDGFLQSRNDLTKKPASNVLAIGMRSIMNAIPPFDRASFSQPYNMDVHLMAGNFLYNGAAFPLAPETLEKYTTIVYSAFEPPAGFANDLHAWLETKSGRTLITHSFIPTRYAAPYQEWRDDTISFLQPGGQESRFGIGRILPGTTSSGVFEAHDPALGELLKELQGKTISFSRPICNVEGKPTRVLATLGGEPLISEWKVGAGRVLYLHFYANERGKTSGAAEQEIIQALLKYVGETPVAKTPEGWAAIKFEGNSEVFMVFNTKARTDFEYQGKPVTVFTAKADNVTGEAKLKVAKPGARYSVTNLIDQSIEQSTSDNLGFVTVPLEGWNLLGVSVSEIATPDEH